MKNEGTEEVKNTFMNNLTTYFKKHGVSLLVLFIVMILIFCVYIPNK